MKKALTFVIFAVLFLSTAGVASASSLFTQTISLNTGWNIVSTPRVLDNYGFSAAETVNNFDIYVLNPSDPSGWSTMAGMGQSEFQPLYGYFVNNKTGVNQTLTLNYKQEVGPNERLFERNFTQTGWYSIGSANPTYVKSKCSDTSDINNVGNILDSLSSKFSSVIDFTDGSFLTDPNSVGVDTQWKSVTPSDANSLNDLRELKGYGIYANQGGALYSGFQNTDGVCVSLTSIVVTTPATKLSYAVGDTLDITGLVVTGTYGDGSTQVETVTADDVTGFDSTTPVTGQVLTITVNRRTTTYTVDIAAGHLSVSVSTASQQGTSASIAISSMPQVLGVYDVYAVGEDILLTDVNAELLGTGVGVGDISDVGIYNNDGALLSDQVNLSTTDWDTTPTPHHFTLNILIPANVTKQLIFKAVTNGVIAGDDVSITLVNGLMDNTRSMVGSGMSSSAQAGVNNITVASTLSLPPITLNPIGSFGTAGVLIGNTATSIWDQTFLGPVSQAVTGTIKVTANNEDQRLRDLILTGVTSVGNVAAYISSVALYDGTTQIANFITPVGNTATFTTADVLVPTTFVKDTPKVLTIVANIISPLPAEGTTLRWIIAAGANNFETTGITSGAVLQHSAVSASDFRTNLGAYNEGGTYTMRSNVLEMSKSTDSPLGTLARGTFATVAKYDLNSKGAGQNLGLSAITFTSTVGLPSALTSSVVATGVLNDASLFRLYDVDNGVAISATRFLNVANGTIAFSGITAAAFPAVTYGQTRHLALQVTTTNAALWPAYTSMTWTVLTAADVVVPDAGVGFGGTVYSIPASANTVTIGL